MNQMNYFQFLIFVATIGIPRSFLTASTQQKPSRNYVKQCSYNSNKSAVKSLIDVYNANTNSLTPEQYVAQYYTEYNTILFSIVIENHSQFRMINGKHMKFTGCEDNKVKVNTFRKIDGASSDIVVVHNGDKSGQRVCGMISWDVDEFDPRQKIQVSFNIPWKGSCKTKPKSRENRYAVSIAPDISSGDDGEHQLYGETNCIENVDGNIRVDSEILPLRQPNIKGSQGEYCAPVLTLRVFDISKTNYNTYYIPIAITLVIGSIAILIGFICLKRYKQRKESNRRKWIAKEPEARPMQVTAVTQTDDVMDINLLYTSKHQKTTNDQIEIAQVYMSVNSYDMVYMSQTSRDLIQNYQPSVPMPFMNQITANSKEAITEQISSELDTVGEKGESKCGSENGSIRAND